MPARRVPSKDPTPPRLAMGPIGGTNKRGVMRSCYGPNGGVDSDG